MILNVTYNGWSRDFEVRTGSELTDDDVKRTAAELASVPESVFDNYVVDRSFVAMSRGNRVYLRPKVPFG